MSSRLSLAVPRHGSAHCFLTQLTPVLPHLRAARHLLQEAHPDSHLDLSKGIALWSTDGGGLRTLPGDIFFMGAGVWRMGSL